MTAYLLTHWDGWILHSLIAAALMHPFITNSYPWLMFGMHVVFWPLREAWQHADGLGLLHGLQNIWTLHRFIEWSAPIAASFIVMIIALRWPYVRDKSK